MNCTKLKCTCQFIILNLFNIITGRVILKKIILYMTIDETLNGIGKLITKKYLSLKRFCVIIYMNFDYRQNFI